MSSRAGSEPADSVVAQARNAFEVELQSPGIRDLAKKLLVEARIFGFRDV